MLFMRAASGFSTPAEASAGFTVTLARNFLAADTPPSGNATTNTKNKEGANKYARRMRIRIRLEFSCLRRNRDCAIFRRAGINSPDLQNGRQRLSSTLGF